jgi:hypothetical protein
VITSGYGRIASGLLKVEGSQYESAISVEGWYLPPRKSKHGIDMKNRSNVRQASIDGQRGVGA